MTLLREVPSRVSRHGLGATLLLSAGVGLFGCWVTGMYAFVGLPWLGAAIAAVSLAAAFAGALLLILARGGDRRELAPVAVRMLGRGRRVLLGAAASAMLLVLVALGAIDGSVWMPEALVPGMTAAEVRAAMDAAGELGTALATLSTWAVIWGLVALVPFALAVAGASAASTARRIWMLALAIAAGAVFFQWMGTFSMGMGIADTFFVGGGQSGFWVVYSLVGQAALIALIALALLEQRSPRARS